MAGTSSGFVRSALEPFDFERANVSGELWLGEGFTSYYDDLIMARAGLANLSETVASVSRVINAVQHSPARRLRSVVEMSRLAPFTDAARAMDRTNWGNTFISYYTWGAAIGLGLDLSLRARADPGRRGRHRQRARHGELGRLHARHVAGSRRARRACAWTGRGALHAR